MYMREGASRQKGNVQGSLKRNGRAKKIEHETRRDHNGDCSVAKGIIASRKRKRE